MTERSKPDKNAVHAFWTGKAPMWDRHADQIADMAARMNRPLIEAVGIELGQRVLDLASGAGEPALSISERVGPTGSVTATDMVPEMLAGARRRAAERGLKNMAFEIADMETLPFADGTFDRVTCRFGLMFCPHPEHALAEAYRVLNAGGRAGFMIWGPRDDTTMFRVMAAAADTLFAGDSDYDLTTPFRLGDGDTLARLMSAAGFTQVEEREQRYTPRVPAGRPFWMAQADMSLGPVLERAGASKREAFHAAVAEGFEAFRDGDSYQLAAHARIGVGVKGGA